MWSPSRSTRLSVAAAAVVLLAVALAFLTQGLSNGSVESIAHVHFLDSTSRAGDIETIDLGEEAAGFLLFLQVDLAPGELPLSLAITNAAGNEVHAGRYDEELIRGRYVVLYCRHSLFPPGNYEATITTSRESGSRRTTYQFFVASTL